MCNHKMKARGWVGWGGGGWGGVGGGGPRGSGNIELLFLSLFFMRVSPHLCFGPSK